MGKFLDYCTYGHMIDNVILIVTGTLHERDVQVGAWSPAHETCSMLGVALQSCCSLGGIWVRWV